MTKAKDPADYLPRGRPTDYEPDHCDLVVALGKKGKSKAQIAAALGVSRQTLDNWTTAHPEFLDAIKTAREFALAWWEDQGQDGLTAEKFNATAFIFQMKNRFRDDYNDRSALEHTGRNGGPIEYANLTEEEIDARLRALAAPAAAPES